jgi:hypothetical protein
LEVLHETRERTETKEYLGDLLNMYKSVFQVRVHPTNSHVSGHEDILQVDNLEKLEKLANTLKSADPPIPNHLWVEQPENVPTCLAVAPNRRDPKVKKALDKSGCRLWKG